MARWFEIYETYSVVRIQDRTLGLTYYLLTAAILLWSFITVVWNKGYMEFEAPHGAAEIHLVQLKDLTQKDFYCPEAVANLNGMGSLASSSFSTPPSSWPNTLVVFLEANEDLGYDGGLSRWVAWILVSKGFARR